MGYAEPFEWMAKLDITSDWYVHDGVLIGRCSKCWQQLLLTETDCWHSYNVNAACPPEPSDVVELAKMYEAGHRTLRPGIEFFEPMPDPVYLIVGSNAKKGDAFYLGQCITEAEAFYYGQEPFHGASSSYMYGRMFTARPMTPPSKE